MAGHQAQVPPRIRDYYRVHHPDTTGHPVITAVYAPGRGWRPTGFRKRVSVSWLRKLSAQGVTDVRVSAGGYDPEFSVREILRRPGRRRPRQVAADRAGA